MSHCYLTALIHSCPQDSTYTGVGTLCMGSSPALSSLPCKDLSQAAPWVLPMPSGRDAKGKNPTKEQKQHPHALQKIPWITNYLSWSPSHSDTHAPNSLNPAQTQPKVLKLRHTALVGTRGWAAPPGVLTEQLRCSRFLWAMVAQGNGGGTTPGSAQAAWGTWGWAWWT